MLIAWLMGGFARYICAKCINEVERIILIKCVEGSKDTMQHRSRRGMQKLSGKMERIRTTLWRTIRIVPKK